MSLVKSPLRLFVSAIVVTSVVVIAGTIKDMSFHSKSFMAGSEPDQITHNRLDDTYEREVASSNKVRIPVIYFPLNDANQLRINGSWLLTRFLDQNEREESLDIKVSFELIGNSLIKVNNEDEQIFSITFLSSYNTIGLVKAVDDGFEILEARKIPDDPIEAIEVVEAVVKKEVKVKGLIADDIQYLSLKTVLHPKKSKQILKGESVEGSLKKLHDSIENFSVIIYLKNNEELRLDIPFTKINDGGQFNEDGPDGPTSGVITNNGKKGHYRVRFVTGPLAGAFLNFIPQDEYEEDIYEEDSYSEEDPYEVELRSQRASEMVEQKLNEQSAATNSREMINETFEGELNFSSEEVSPEEMALKIKESGFDFSQMNKRRNLASEK